MKVIPNFVKNLPIEFGVCASFGQEIVFAFNEHFVFPAASIVKVPLCLLILKKCEEGKLNIFDKVKIDNKVPGAGIIKDLSITEYSIIDLITLALIISDNTASNTLIDLTSFDEINDFLKEMGLKNTCINRKFMVDLVNPPVNFTTPWESWNIFNKLVNGEILSDKNTLLFFDILGRQQYREKIPLFLNEFIVCNKTGDISGISHDVAVIFFDKTIEESFVNKRYSIVSIFSSFSEQVSRYFVNNIIGEIALNLVKKMEKMGGMKNVHTYLG